MVNARPEIMLAIECQNQFGHVAEPWMSFNILHQIEVAAGDQTAARAAWRQARDAYLAYRQQGGFAHVSGGKLVDGVLGHRTLPESWLQMGARETYQARHRRQFRCHHRPRPSNSGSGTLREAGGIGPLGVPCDTRNNTYRTGNRTKI
jgi:hypothetical protein